MRQLGTVLLWAWVVLLLILALATFVIEPVGATKPAEAYESDFLVRVRSINTDAKDAPWVYIITAWHYKSQTCFIRGAYQGPWIETKPGVCK